MSGEQALRRRALGELASSLPTDDLDVVTAITLSVDPDVETGWHT